MSRRSSERPNWSLSGRQFARFPRLSARSRSRAGRVPNPMVEDAARRKRERRQARNLRWLDVGGVLPFQPKES